MATQVGKLTGCHRCVGPVAPQTAGRSSSSSVGVAQTGRPLIVADVLDGAQFKDGIRVADDDNYDNEMTEETVPVA